MTEQSYYEIRVRIGGGINSADYCREKGWGTGTRLVGDEGYGPTVIEITGLGESNVLAKTITHNGKPPKGGSYESLWTLENRDWKPVEAV